MAITLTSLTPTSGPAGTILTLNGAGFATGCIVWFSGLGHDTSDSTPIILSSSAATCSIPDAFDGLGGGLLVFVMDGTEESNSLAFALAASPDTEAPYGLCSIGQVKSLLGISETDVADESRFKRLIAMASAQIKGYCKRTFAVISVTAEALDGSGTDTLELNQSPIISVSALSIEGVAVDISEVKVYPDYIRFAGGGGYNPRLRGDSRLFPEGVQNVVVSYQAGYAEVPAEISDACALQVVFLMNLANKQGIISETNQVANASTTYAQSPLSPFVRATCNRYRGQRLRAV
jgi:hypothetical protein